MLPEVFAVFIGQSTRDLEISPPFHHPPQGVGNGLRIPHISEPRSFRQVTGLVGPHQSSDKSASRHVNDTGHDTNRGLAGAAKNSSALREASSGRRYMMKVNCKIE